MTFALLLVFAVQSGVVHFAPQVESDLSGDQPEDILITDLDHDGDLDLVVPSSVSLEVSLCFNDGQGDFQDTDSLHLSFSSPHDVGSWGVGGGDFNADGWTDFVFGNAWNDGREVAVYFADPQDPGSPILSQVLTAGKFPIDFATGDFDQDGDVDLAVAGNVLYGVMIFLNDGSGQFGAGVPVNAANGLMAQRIAVADFDHDGRPDLALGHYWGISIFWGDGSGGFPSGSSYGGGGTGLALGDFDSDGNLDVAGIALYSNQIVVTRLNGARGGYGASIATASGDLDDLAAGDFDGDGSEDLAASFDSIHQVGVFVNHGDGSFHAPQLFATGTQPRPVAAGRFNADGRTDLAIGLRNYGNTGLLSVLANASAPQAWLQLTVGHLRNASGLPLLRGAGALLPGSAMSLSSEHLPPNGQAWFVVGNQRQDRPFRGGTLVPKLLKLVGPRSVDALGGANIQLTVPNGAPSGARAWFQVWSADSASNGLQLTLP